jgi:Flp pilus assembly protein TadG
LLDAREERGSAAIESVFSIVVVIFMMLGVVEIAFSLYARNVVAASAHEGARAAIERGRSTAEAEAIATETVRRSAGGLVDELGVDVGSQLIEGRSVVNVVVTGRVKPFGPIPFPMHLRTEASAVEETEVR